MDNLNNNNIIDESQGYAIISKESVRLMSESIGVSRLDDPVCLLLAEDVSYRLRELVHNAAHYMRLCRRKQLLDQDVQKALELSDNEPLLGHGTRTPNSTDFYQLKDEEFCFVDDKEVNLIEFALNPVTSLQPIEEHSIQKKWLFTEGQPLPSELNGWNDHWTVRQLAARLLARFVTLCDHSVPDVRERLLRNVTSQLQARSTPLYCRYGLVYWLMCCGCQSVEDVLIADVDAVWNDLDVLLTAESTRQQELLLSRNASLAADAIRCAFVLWIRALWLRDEFPVTVDLYHYLMAIYQCPPRKNGFGSSVSSSKPILAMSHMISDEEVNDFLTNIPTEEMATSMPGDAHRSPGAKSDRSCERVHRSDSESPTFGDSFDVTVRSTISATGIKLTIAKRRRGSDSSKKKRKRSRRSESRNDIDSMEAAFPHWKLICTPQPIVIRLHSASKEQRKPIKSATRKPVAEQPVISTFSRLFSASVRQGGHSFRKITPSRPMISAVKGSSALSVYCTL